MKKQSAKTPKTTIRASIDFETFYDVLGLENGILALIQGRELDNVQRKDLQRIIDLVESLTGSDLLSYWLENHN